MTDYLSLKDEHGVVSNVALDTLLVFLDETGVETLTDPNAPFFGIGGLVIVARDYFSQVEKPWHQLKEKYFGGIVEPLHAADLRYPSKEIIESLNSYFESNRFGRIAVTCTDKTINETGIRVEEIILAAMWDRIATVANNMSWKEILIIFEENHRLIPAIRQELMTKKPQNGNREIAVTYHTMLKDSRFAGMEVADFIIHTAGRQARIMRDKHFVKEFKEAQPDFIKVFESYPSLTSYLSISRIRR